MREPERPSSPVALHKQLSAIWGTAPGLGRLSAVNHTVVGRRFIVTAIAFFGFGGLLAMVIRAQLATPAGAFLGPGVYSQVFTVHGTVMMFLFAIPMLEGWAMYLLPKMLGARDMAFPRLSAYGYWCYLFGGSLIVLSLAFGVAPDGGWFMYTPLTSQPYSPGINADIWLLGITFVEISAISAAVEILVTVLKLRSPGMALHRMPIFGWYMLVTAGMILVGFPPLILGSILLEVERAFGWPFFDPERGGHPLLWQHLFWIFGHPEVYIIFIPAAGLLSTMIPVLSRHPLVGYAWVVGSLVALGFLSFGLWVHHMFTVGIPLVSLGYFSAASMLVTVPQAVQIFSWLSTMGSGRPRLDTPMLYILGFFFVFIVGGLTGIMVASVPFDWQAHDSHFIVAHLHYVLIGGFVFPILAAAYFWLPHFTGRAAIHGLGKTAFWLIFLGMNATFLGMHLTGLRGMPRRVYTYADGYGWTDLNLVSSIGGFVMTMGFAIVAVDLLLQPRLGRRIRRDPWGAETLEWATATPPPSYGLASIPAIESRAPLTGRPDLGARIAAGEGYLGFTRNGWPETIAVDLVSGAPEQVVILPRPTYLPLASAAVTGSFFLATLFKLYWLVPLALAATAAILLAWTRSTGSAKDHGLLAVGHGIELPPHWESDRPPSWYAMAFLLAANAALFGSLVFGHFFLWFVSPGAEADLVPPAGYTLLVLLAGGALLASAAGRIAVGRVRARGRPGPWLLLAVAGHAAAAASGAVLFAVMPDPGAAAIPAVAAALVAYATAHAGVGLLLATYAVRRARMGRVSARRTADLMVPSLWHDYTAATSLFVALVLAGSSAVLVP